MAPKFSAYPYEHLRKLTAREAQLATTVARWVAARTTGERLAKLAGGRIRVEVATPASAAFDPFAARCEVRIAGASIEVRGASLGVRALAQRLLGGPAELAAPRPLGAVERSMFALAVATALEDLGVAGEVWPMLDDELAPPESQPATRAGHAAARSHPLHVHHAGQHAARPGDVIELAATLGDIALSVQLCASDLALRVPPSRPWPAWFATTTLAVPIVLGRCALHRDDLARLALRSLITLERPVGTAEHLAGAAIGGRAAELDLAGAAIGGRAAGLGAGAVGLVALPGAVAAEVTTGYVARDMSLPDDAHLELTVALGTTQLSLRQLGELAIGQIIQLGRPLAGPFELRAAGRVVGRGELVDVDGELAVRIVSLGD